MVQNPPLREGQVLGGEMVQIGKNTGVINIKKKSARAERADAKKGKSERSGLPVFSTAGLSRTKLRDDTGSGRSRTARDDAATCSASRTPRSRCRRPARPS